MAALLPSLLRVARQQQACRSLPALAAAELRASSGALASTRRGLASSAEAPATTAAAEQGGGRQRWGWVLLLPSALAAFLGCWQVSRYRWKVDLLARREQGLQEEPLDVLEEGQQAGEFRRVAARGQFRHGDSLFVGPRPRTVMGTATPGFTLVTPLVCPRTGRGVLVARGWVPAEWRTNPQLRALNSPAGQVEVSGVVRGSEARSGFVPDNAPARGQWFWVDVPAMAAACGLPPDTPLLEEYAPEAASDASAALPTQLDVLAFQGRQPRAPVLFPLPRPAGELLRTGVTPTDHRNYALTWFALSAATGLLAARALRRRPPARARAPRAG